MRPGGFRCWHTHYRATWRQRHGHTLTVEGYRSTGGIHHAVATTADRVFTGLDSAGQHAARTLFLRLIKIGDDTEDTRRRVARTDLLRGLDPGRVGPVVDAFTQGRLLTQEQDTVEITHEALLRAWPRLRQWIDTDRAGNLIRQELEEAAAIWIRDGRDAAGLYRGSRLKTARTWATSRSPESDVSPTASEFLALSTRRERRFRLARLLAAGLVVVLLIAGVGVFGAYAYDRNREAKKDQALTAAAANLVDNPAESLRNAVKAYRVSPDADTRQAVLTAASDPRGVVIAGSPSEPVAGLVITPDQQHVVTYDAQGRIRVINDNGRPTKAAKASHLTGVFAAATSPSASQVALATNQGTAAVINVETGRQVELATDEPLIPALWWLESSPDNLVLVVSTSGHVATYSATTGQEIAHLPGPAYGARPTADGQIVTSDRDFRLRIWNARTAEKMAESTPLAGQTRNLQPYRREVVGVTDDNNLIRWDWRTSPEPHKYPLKNISKNFTLMTVSEDAHTVALVVDKAVQIYNLDDGSLQRSVPKQPGWLLDMKLDSHGQWIATAGGDGRVRVWSAQGHGLLSRATYEFVAGEDGVARVSYLHQGASLVFLGRDGTVRLCHLPQAQFYDLHDWVMGLDIIANRRWLAAVSEDGKIYIVDPVGASTVPVAVGGPVDVVKFDPTDPHRLFTLEKFGTQPVVWRWDSGGGAERLSGFETPPGSSDSLKSLAVSKDGRWLVAGSSRGNIYLWDARTGRLTGSLALEGSGEVFDIAFDPSGQMLAAANRRGVFLIKLGVRPTPTLLKFPGATSVVFDQRGQHIVGAASDWGALSVWTWDGKLVHDLDTRADTVGRPSFSDDGRLVAVGTGEGLIEVWDVHSGRMVLRARRHSDMVNDVLFLPGDQSRLVSASDDSTVTVSTCQACDNPDAVVKDAQRWVDSN
jgi:YD repeat-containing protein